MHLVKGFYRRPLRLETDAGRHRRRPGHRAAGPPAARGAAARAGRASCSRWAASTRAPASCWSRCRSRPGYGVEIGLLLDTHADARARRDRAGQPGRAQAPQPVAAAAGGDGPPDPRRALARCADAAASPGRGRGADPVRAGRRRVAAVGHRRGRLADRPPMRERDRVARWQPPDCRWRRGGMDGVGDRADLPAGRRGRGGRALRRRRGRVRAGRGARRRCPRRHPHPAAAHGISTASDVRELRFPQAVRGYRMDEVDWVLDRLPRARPASERRSATELRRPGGRAGVGPGRTARCGPRAVSRTELVVPVDVDAPAETVWHAVTDWAAQGEWMLGTRVTVDGPGDGRQLGARLRGLHRGRAARLHRHHGDRRVGAAAAVRRAPHSAGSCAATACSRWCRSARTGPGSSGRSCWTCRSGALGALGWPLVQPGVPARASRIRCALAMARTGPGVGRRGGVSGRAAAGPPRRPSTWPTTTTSGAARCTASPRCSSG